MIRSGASLGCDRIEALEAQENRHFGVSRMRVDILRATTCTKRSGCTVNGGNIKKLELGIRTITKRVPMLAIVQPPPGPSLTNPGVTPSAPHGEPSAHAEPTSPCAGWEKEKAVRDVCVKAYSEYFLYDANVLGQEQRAFDFELFSTKVILGVVLLLVLSGLLFSALQFAHALYGHGHPSAASSAASSEAGNNGEQRAADVPSTKELSSYVELSLSGLKLKSSILGLLLLAVSMGFFYLYLRYVYPIQEITTTQSAPNQAGK